MIAKNNLNLRLMKTFIGGIAWPTILLFVSAWSGYLIALWAFHAHLIGKLPLSMITTLAVIMIFTPIHEASHANIEGKSRGTFITGGIGYLSGLMFLAPFRAFKSVHLVHHQNTNDPDRDPDYWVHGSNMFSTSLRCLAIYPYYIYAYYFDLKRPWREKIVEVALIAVYWSVLIYGLMSPLAEMLIWGVVLPLFLGTGMHAFLFDWVPHYPHHDMRPLHNSRALPHRFYDIAMFGQNFHLVHHLNPRVPFHRYRKAYYACGLNSIESEEGLASGGILQTRGLKRRVEV
ncbi:MAG: hypothetical protein EOP10_11510 [Proteobacteria bacterium]|nr:MAG: hypothetical protein EOP10_11510 [Pseudomonadota bacterium]